MKEYTLKDGTKVEYKDFQLASGTWISDLSKADKEILFTWWGTTLYESQYSLPPHLFPFKSSIIYDP